MSGERERPPAEAEGRSDQPGGRSSLMVPAGADSSGSLARADGLAEVRGPRAITRSRRTKAEMAAFDRALLHSLTGGSGRHPMRRRKRPRGAAFAILKHRAGGSVLPLYAPSPTIRPDSIWGASR